MGKFITFQRSGLVPLIVNVDAILTIEQIKENPPESLINLQFGKTTVVNGTPSQIVNAIDSYTT